jgi:hypothetical protein
MVAVAWPSFFVASPITATLGQYYAVSLSTALLARAWKRYHEKGGGGTNGAICLKCFTAKRFSNIHGTLFGMVTHGFWMVYDAV